jgi:hypothetical protein
MIGFKYLSNNDRRLAVIRGAVHLRKRRITQNGSSVVKTNCHRKNDNQYISSARNQGEKERHKKGVMDHTLLTALLIFSERVLRPGIFSIVLSIDLPTHDVGRQIIGRGLSQIDTSCYLED